MYSAITNFHVPTFYLFRKFFSSPSFQTIVLEKGNVLKNVRKNVDEHDNEMRGVESERLVVWLNMKGFVDKKLLKLFIVFKIIKLVLQIKFS